MTSDEPAKESFAIRRGADTVSLGSGLPAQSASGMPVLREIGRYRILRVIGEGGMGTVYEAEQDKPRRVVALKVIRPGYASPQLLKRFEQESQVLGRLQHPGIAQIYEAGTHEVAPSAAGSRGVIVPYFAMEYIRGRGLKVFMEEQNLGTRQRLELVAKVCDAVHHAHQKGVIHRDLKPGNILVDESGQPKILDFGVARATDSDIQAATIQTDVGQLIGTIPYMSPEQVAADPQGLDTRSDVYALGVIAYEALAGRLPYDLKHKMIHEAARVIREEEPAPLSTINRVFRGDVETIVAKSLEKDKTRRYQSAAELASDIRRYLHDEPIVARRASAAYQFKKFAQRHKAVVVGVAAVFLVLVAGMIVSTTLYFRAENARGQAEKDRAAAEAAQAAETEQRQLAESRRAQAEAVTGFLRDMLTTIQPARAKGREISVREVLDEAAKTVHERLKDEPLVEVSIQRTIAETYYTLGLYKSAIPHWDAAREILNQTYGPDHIETIVGTFRLGLTYYFGGDSEKALEILQGALSAACKSLGEENRLTARVMDMLGMAFREQGRLDDAEPLLARAMDVRERLNVSDEERADSMSHLGLLYLDRQRYKEAEELCRRSLEIFRRELSNEHLSTIRTIGALADICARQAKWDEAEQLSREAAETGQRVLGVEPRDSRKALARHSRALKMLGRFAEAESVSRQLLESQRHTLESGDPDILNSLLALSELALAQDARERALQYWEEQRLSRSALGESTSFPPRQVNNYVFSMLASPLCEQRDAEEILPLAERSVEQTGAKDPAILDTLSLAYWMSGKREEAIATQTKAIDLLPPGESNLRKELEERLLSFLQDSQDAETPK